MRRVALVTAVCLVAGLGWAASAVEEERGVLARPSAEEPPPDAEVAPPLPVPEVLVPSMPPAPGEGEEEPIITPPPPIPELGIPPIPPVDPENPFRPREWKPVVAAGPAPLEEGKRLFDREGRLDVDDEGEMIFVFDSGDVPMRLLESRWREYLESVTEGGAKHARWRVSGIVTLYHRQNYLLLTKVVRIEPEEERL